MRDQEAYDGLDTQTLFNLLTNPGQRPEVHRAALSAFSRRKARDRTQRLLDVLKTVINEPARYDQNVMMATIDILATDPDAKATEAMIEMIPVILSASEKRTGLSSEFREYFYEALITRRREDDIDVWRSEIPNFKGTTLVSMLFDPSAKALKSLEPLRLISRLPKKERSEALRTVFFRSLVSKPALAFEALRLILNPNSKLKSESK